MKKMPCFFAVIFIKFKKNCAKILIAIVLLTLFTHYIIQLSKIETGTFEELFLYDVGEINDVMLKTQGRPSIILDGKELNEILTYVKELRLKTAFSQKATGYAELTLLFTASSGSGSKDIYVRFMGNSRIMALVDDKENIVYNVTGGTVNLELFKKYLEIY